MRSHLPDAALWILQGRRAELQPTSATNTRSSSAMCRAQPRCHRSCSPSQQTSATQNPELHQPTCSWNSEQLFLSDDTEMEWYLLRRSQLTIPTQRVNWKRAISNKVHFQINRIRKNATICHSSSYFSSEFTIFNREES